MAPRFQLIRHFTLYSLAAITAVAAALIVIEERQAGFFETVQQREVETVAAIQTEFVSKADEAARSDLIAINEQGNINLTRMFVNALWPHTIAPFLAETATIDFSPCRALPDETDPQGRTVAGPAKAECFRRGGVMLTQLRGFGAVDQAVRDAMRGSSVVKIKVFDLQGTTIYATDATQMGEDKSRSPGWTSAARDGKALSELTFSGEFSAAHGRIENRNLIYSYLPVREPGSERIAGVVELYADVTPFIARINATGEAFRQSAHDKQQRLLAQAAVNRSAVDDSSRTQVVIVVALLLGLFCVLLVVVRRAQRVMERQASEAEASRQRLAQSERMTSLGQMVAGVAHQLNTPLAFSRNNVQMSIGALDDLAHAVERSLITRAPVAAGPIDDADGPADTLADAMEDVREARQMLEDVLLGMNQMNELVDNLRHFSRLDSARTASANINAALGSVCYIARTVISTRIELVKRFQDLPPISVNLSQLNQVFLNLIVNAAQAIRDSGTITVATAVEGDQVCIAIRDNGCGIAPEVLPRIFDAYFTTKPAGEGTGLGLSIARDFVREHGGDIVVRSQVGVGSEFRVLLPIKPRGEA